MDLLNIGRVLLAGAMTGRVRKTERRNENNPGGPEGLNTPKQKKSAGIQKDLSFWCEESGQVSAEMLIMIAALIAVAIVLIGQLQNSAKVGAKNLDAKIDKAWSELDKIGK
ncbi:MAG: hypothetical protein ABH863_01340 [Candidatus Micrarchaeota archaeon]